MASTFKNHLKFSHLNVFLHNKIIACAVSSCVESKFVFPLSSGLKVSSVTCTVLAQFLILKKIFEKIFLYFTKTFLKFLIFWNGTLSDLLPQLFTLFEKFPTLPKKQKNPFWKNFLYFPYKKFSYISRWNFSVCTLPRKKKFTPKKFREFSPYFKTTADQAIR